MIKVGKKASSAHIILATDMNVHIAYWPLQKRWLLFLEPTFSDVFIESFGQQAAKKLTFTIFQLSEKLPL